MIISLSRFFLLLASNHKLEKSPTVEIRSNSRVQLQSYSGAYNVIKINTDTYSHRNDPSLSSVSILPVDF